MKKLLIVITLVLFLGGFGMGNALADSSASANADANAGAEANNSQGQNQGQGQQQGMALDDVGNIKDSFNSNAKYRRPFAIPGEVNYGPLINYYGKPLPSEGFQRVEELIMYGCWFTEGALQSMLEKVEDAEAEFKTVNSPNNVERSNTRWIKIIIQKAKVENAKLVGYVTARSDDRRTTMTEVMAKAALEALQNGCNVIHFTAQGAVRDAESFGWGIGFNTTAATINSNDGGDFSTVSSGGFGISKGTAGMRDKPWLQGFGLVVEGLDYPEEAKAEMEEAKEEAKSDEQTGNHKNS